MALWLITLLVTTILAWKTRRSLSREKAAWLAAASLLLAPYAAGNSYLTVYAVGVIPLLQSWRLPGAVLILLTNLPYLVVNSFEIQYYWSANYWCFLLFSAWGVLVFRTARLEMQGLSPGRKTPPVPTDWRP
jgi:hypothetical protein